MYIHDLITQLHAYWAQQGCLIRQPMDLPMGAGTFHPATFFHVLRQQPGRVAFTQPCRRPADGREGQNPNRVQHYYQYQVLLTPAPDNIQDLFLRSLEHVGLDLAQQDVRFVEDNWESPTQGAWGLGWEVWLNGMEITQFTYFQQMGGQTSHLITGEITYGIERLGLFLQQKDNINNLIYQRTAQGDVTYGDIFRDFEVQHSQYNATGANVARLTRQFEDHLQTASELLEASWAHPSYEYLILASHTFNIMEARGALSHTERQQHILRMQHTAKRIAELCTPTHAEDTTA